MEMALRVQTPLCSRSRPVLVLRPATAAAATGVAQSIVKCSRFSRSRLVRCMVASSDYPKRNPRRSSAPKSKGTASRGYAPGPAAESSTKKIDQSSTEEVDLGTSNGTLSSEATEQESTPEEESDVDLTENVSTSAELEGVNKAETEEVEQKQPSALASTSMDAESIDRELEEYRGKISALVGSSLGSTQGQDQSVIGVHEQDELVIISSSEQDISVDVAPEQSQSVVDVIEEDPTKQNTIVSEKDITEAEVEQIASKNLEAGELVISEDDVGASKDASKEPLVAGDELRITEDAEEPKPEMQEQVQEDVDPQALKRRLEALAYETYSIGNKCFVFPEVVKADSVIELYLNRSISALASQPDILIKGAFNGWRWNPFTEKLHKSELTGDWWCCKLYIPKQAYRLDFVFFNGDTVYENNNYNDFVLQIKSDIDEHSFEDFLLEEKQRELERLAAEEAERERQAEEERRKEEERAKVEAKMRPEIQLIFYLAKQLIQHSNFRPDFSIF